MNGFTRSISAAVPETITDKVPARAPAGPPEIGQSTILTPGKVASISRMNFTPTVQVFTRVFIRLPRASPSGPFSTARNAARVGSDTNTVSHISASSRGVCARRAWRASNGAIAASFTSQMANWCPPSTSFVAIGWPILPTPRYPTSISSPPTSSLQLCRQP